MLLVGAAAAPILFRWLTARYLYGVEERVLLLFLLGLVHSPTLLVIALGAAIAM
jgi:hypothetical protein